MTVKRRSSYSSPKKLKLSNDVSEPIEADIYGGETHSSAQWLHTIKQVVKSVVSVHFAQVAAFDGEPPLVSEATGFVVDASRGIIMTNRHVVGPGPFVGFAIFDNHEEVEVSPIYRDPVHDFGLLKFDPKAVHYMAVEELPLVPEGAKVGVEIRVVGNDAGEKLSILSGFISRLDRNAPDYGDLTYNDFNTEYIQAAASASGGSSGSPVVNVLGQVVALQAGGSSESSTDYFLPLYRALRALQCVQRGEPVSRGTIQTQWFLQPFDECRRLGLSAHDEKNMRSRFPQAIGLLVAETVLPGGPGYEKIQEGDILLAVNGESIASFSRVDDILDSSVGNAISIEICRGGDLITATCTVQDLHTITPDRYVEVSGSTFHNLSYQMARIYGLPVRGVFVASTGGSFKVDNHTSKGWLLESIDGVPTNDLDEFIDVMRKVPDRKRCVVTMRNLRDMHNAFTKVVRIDRHWTGKFRLAVRNDKTGIWDFSSLGPSPDPEPVVSYAARFVPRDLPANLEKSFVTVNCVIPVTIDGFPQTRRVSNGLVLDAEEGLVVVSRYTVPYNLCDIWVTVADSIEVEASVVFLHPLANYAIIKYDPSIVKVDVVSATLSAEPVNQGDSVLFVGHTYESRLLVVTTTVLDIPAIVIPPNPMTPRYRAVNVDAISIDTPLASKCPSGVLCAHDGTVKALWMNFLGERINGIDSDYRVGISVSDVMRSLKAIKAHGNASPRILDVEFHTLQLSQARVHGVSEEWLQKIEDANDERRQVFMVRKTSAGVPQQLKEGDIVLALNDKVFTRASDLEIASNLKEVTADIVRNRQHSRLKVHTVATDNIETSRIIMWCGAIIHEPHHAVRQQISKIHSKVYVSARMKGSPACQFGLTPTSFITHVNGAETKTLDGFMAEIAKISHGSYVRLRLMTFDNIPTVISIKTNLHYFPTMELCHTGSRWVKTTFKEGMHSVGLEMSADLLEDIDIDD
ncbi:hypothetical protein CANCADRAFT_76141 [Tortispora caseinolytica NRRL Y-17796]|uniref:Pro-apoptotic serine protease NMA111 n=1 Tax=Tortispora caseinolytica NRRL Y-17796 TaxID=767744 RepID=A0A1E4TJJ0_9ASCO|nr:hypothetical protein CANCADRAFT_76141 [Tortispora caseinolytica NRRL Y-17796]